MGNIIGNKAFVGNYEANKIYLGDTLVYEKGLLFSMPSYNNTVPYVNSFGFITFTGGTDVDGWIGYNASADIDQKLNIKPYYNSLYNKFLITFDAKLYPKASTSTIVPTCTRANSDIASSDGAMTRLYFTIGTDGNSTNWDTIKFYRNGEKIGTTVFTSEKKLEFSMGFYIDTSLKRCYVGSYIDYSRIPRTNDNLSIPEYNNEPYYIEYTNTLNFDFIIAATSTVFPTNGFRNIRIRKVSNVNIRTGEITYL